MQKKIIYIVRRLPLSSDLKICCRAHYAFVMDCLDAYILGATMEVMQLEHFDDLPIKWRPPPLLMTAEKSDHYQWLLKLGQEILEKHVKLDKGKTNLNCKRIDPLTSILLYMFARYLSSN